MRAWVGMLALAILGIGAWIAVSSREQEQSVDEVVEEASVELGPVDGFDLAPTEIGRVALGTQAPDFSLDSYAGDVVTLSDFRGQKNVLLVFYRGHW